MPIWGGGGNLVFPAGAKNGLLSMTQTLETTSL